MVTVTFIDVAGVERRIDDAKEGATLMEVGRANAVAGILADCGGSCSCATCHVYVDAAWLEKVGPPNAIEFGMLDMVADVSKPNSRLSCQIELNASHDGLRVTVAPSF